MLVSLGKDVSEWRIRKIIEEIDTDGNNCSYCSTRIVSLLPETFIVLFVNLTITSLKFYHPVLL